MKMVFTSLTCGVSLMWFLLNTPQSPKRVLRTKALRPFIEHLQLMLGDTVALDHPESKAGYLLRMLAFRYQKHDFRETEKASRSLLLLR